MAYSSGDDVASSYKTGNASATMESKQLTFMNLVKTHKILLTKSQIPKIKAEKLPKTKQVNTCNLEYLLCFIHMKQSKYYFSRKC